MDKRTINIILLIMLVVGIISLSLSMTFAIDEQAAKLDESTADYNLIYSLKESSKKQLTVSSKEEKFIDITITNTYDSTVRYGMYYYLISPKKMPDSVSITLSDESTDLLENTIKPGQTRVISIRINNESEYSIDLQIGALIGFENGKIEDLVKDGEILIK